MADEKPVKDDDLDALRRTLAESSQREALRDFREQQGAADSEFRSRTWRSLKTLAGWVALVLFLGSAAYDMGSRAIHLIGRR